MATITEEKYKRLKQEVEEAKESAARSQGSLDTLMSNLKEEFNCDDLKEAKELLKELEEKKDKAEATYEKTLKSYEEKWKKDES